MLPIEFDNVNVSRLKLFKNHRAHNSNIFKLFVSLPQKIVTKIPIELDYSWSFIWRNSETLIIVGLCVLLQGYLYLNKVFLQSKNHFSLSNVSFFHAVRDTVLIRSH